MTTLTQAETAVLTRTESADLFAAIDEVRHGGDINELEKIKTSLHIKAQARLCVEVNNDVTIAQQLMNQMDACMNANRQVSFN